MSIEQGISVLSLFQLVLNLGAEIGVPGNPIDRVADDCVETTVRAFGLIQ
ncbi:hypothetical protein [Streptomyces malaysiensis]|nr:hypothetical protein [Streptomyces malaysiensis]